MVVVIGVAVCFWLYLCHISETPRADATPEPPATIEAEAPEVTGFWSVENLQSLTDAQLDEADEITNAASERWWRAYNMSRRADVFKVDPPTWAIEIRPATATETPWGKAERGDRRGGVR
jgi:hypothetical protein